jgi:hypothetical protein
MPKNGLTLGIVALLLAPAATAFSAGSADQAALERLLDNWASWSIRMSPIRPCMPVRENSLRARLSYVRARKNTPRRIIFEAHRTLIARSLDTHRIG